MASHIAATGLTEPDEAIFALDLLRPGDLFVDVGANIGFYTALTARRGARVVAFEPSPDAMATCRRNVARNGLGSIVTLREAACGADAGRIGFSTGLDIRNHVVAENDAAFDVELTTLDRELAGEQPGMAMIKVDAEGHDLEVLRGGLGAIERLLPAVMVEVWAGGIEERRLLEPFGYRAYRYLRDRRTLERMPPDFRGQANLLFICDTQYDAVAERLVTSDRPRLSTPAIHWQPRAHRSLFKRFPSRADRCGTSSARVLWRLGASLVRRRWTRLAAPVVDIGGAVVRADLRSPLGLSLYRYGYCSVESRLLLRLLRGGDVFVDGGANVGLFSVLGASVVGSSGRVLACEPGPGTMALLKANAALNAFDVLELHQVALSEQPGSAHFVVFEDGSGLASFAPEAEGGHDVEVAVTTLDDLTSAWGDRVALVKLDIEGAEVRAIRGASNLIARAAPLFLVEVEPEHLARQSSSIEDLERALAPHGYEAYALTPMGGVSKLSGAWLPPDPAHPNLILASAARAERMSALMDSCVTPGERACRMLRVAEQGH